MANEACNENEERHFNSNLNIRPGSVLVRNQTNSEDKKADIIIMLHCAEDPTKCTALKTVSSCDTPKYQSKIEIKSKRTLALKNADRISEKPIYEIPENRNHKKRVSESEDLKCLHCCSINDFIHILTFGLCSTNCKLTVTLKDAYMSRYFLMSKLQTNSVKNFAVCFPCVIFMPLFRIFTNRPRYVIIVILFVPMQNNTENTSGKSNRVSHKEKYNKAINRQALMHYFQATQYLSPSKGQSPRLSVKGKGKRRKKVSHTSEYLDVYHYLRPGLVDALVYPVHRQTLTQGINSNGNTGNKLQLPPFKEQKLPDEVIGIPWEDFKLEIKRLATFSNLPVHLPVFAIRLAREGFVCLSDVSIICFFCKFVYHGWKSGDRPEELHKQLQPDCPMVKGISCDNQPIIPLPDQQVLKLKQLWHLAEGVPSGQQSTQHYSTEQQSGENETLGQMVYALPNYLSTPSSGARLPDVPAPLPADGRTTTSGQSDLDPDRQPRQGSRQQTLRDGGTTTSSLPMATQGTPLLNSVLSQQLNETHTTVADTLAVDSATDLGSSTSRSQVIDGSAQPEVPSTNGELGNSGSRTGTAESQQVVTYSQLGIVTEPPKRPDMATLQSRISSFRNWPTNHSQNVKDLSEAGFYYAGYGDCGRCFFCGGGLKNWESTDSPLVEHARWFPRCAYVRQCRGQDFIDIVQDLNRTRQQISMADVLEEMRRRKAEGERLQDIVDPSIVSVLDLGYTQSQVDSALQQLQQQGSMVTVEKILDCLQGSGQFPNIGAEGGVESDTEVDNLEDLVSQNSEIRQQRICKICLDKEVSIVFLPCGHLVCCAECSPALRSCPMCRERIKGRVRAFPA